MVSRLEANLGSVLFASLLVKFQGEFESADFVAGRIDTPMKDATGVFILSAVEYAPVVDEFVEAAYSHGWVMDFDWPLWTQSEEARLLRDDEATLNRASADQLLKLLTVCIRQERFCEGALLDAFNSGLILRIVRRAASLADHQSPSGVPRA